MSSSGQSCRVAAVRSLQAAGLLCLLTALPADRLTAQNVGRVNYETYTMPNGLRVVLSEDHSTPVVTVNVWYHVGSANERVGRSGFAHLFEHMMFQGSAHVRKAEHFKLIERAGGGMNGSTRFDHTNYYETLPSNRLNLGLWLEADRMRSLAVTQENFENQRQTVREERRLAIDNRPYAAAIVDLGWALPFDSSACFAYGHSIIGGMADLDSARVEDVQAFFDLYYKPNNAVLSVVGDFDPTEARRLIERYFADIPRGDEPPGVTCDSRFGTGGRLVEVTDNNANLPAVVFAYRTPPASHPDFPAFDLLRMVLGSGESSRLNRRLVREERAALGVSAEPLLGEHARVGPGVLAMFAISNQGVETARLQRLLSEEVDGTRNDSVAAAELTKAQNQYRAGAIRARQTTQDVAEALQRALRYHGSLEGVNAESQRYGSVTASDLRRVAQTYLTTENRLTIIVNPPAGRGGND